MTTSFFLIQGIIKIRTDAVCCIHVSTLLSNQCVSHLQSPDARLFC